jgi:hypothetical protein
VSTSIYNTFGVALAVVLCVVTFLGVLRASHRVPGFLRGKYTRYLLGVVSWAIASPVLHWWGSPLNISLSDAVFLRGHSAGWTFTLMAYSALVGVVAGGIAAHLRPRSSSQ